MVSIGTVLNALPARNQDVFIEENQDDADIIDQILIVHDEFAGDYNKIYKFFDQGDIYNSSECIWDFLKKNLKYHAEGLHDQTVRSPYRILQVGDKVDCKHYSLFIAGVLDAIKRHRRCDWDWTYRFASYNWEPVAAHVFVVVIVNGKELWIDPVLDSFNEDKSPTWEVDKKPMALYKLSGINGIGSVNANDQLVYNKKVAIEDFLVWVNLNLFAFKQLMKGNPAIVNGPVKQYFLKNGYPFDTLVRLLNQ